jgi:hypothetical protein
MEATASFVGVLIAIFAGLLVAIFLIFLTMSGRWKAAEDRARARRIADARMNARLLRLNL